MTDPALADAQLRAEAARAELRIALDEAMGWLKPARLKAEAAIAATHQIDEAKEALRRQVRSHPLALWASLVTLVAFAVYVIRQPASGLIRKSVQSALFLYHRIARRVS